jgi:aldehyde dehydrogenase (NAD+)
MAMPQTIEAVRHSFVAGGDVKRMLINGEWVRAASGKTFESHNPATGDLLATIAQGDKEDIDRPSSPRVPLSRAHGASSSPTNGRRSC